MKARFFTLVGGVLLLGILAALLGSTALAGSFFPQPAQAAANDTPALQGATDTESGALVAFVAPDGPAAKAGIRRGDILLKVGDRTLDAEGELFAAMQQHQPGDVVDVVLQHGDEQRTVAVTLGDRGGEAYLGITLCLAPAEPGSAVAFAFAGGEGALVTEVVPGSPAARVGLQPGDVITAVDGASLAADADNAEPRDLAALIAAHRPGDQVTLTVRRAGEDELELAATLDENPDKPGAAYLGVRYAPAMGMSHWEPDVFGDMPFPPFELPDFELDGLGLTSGAVIGEVVGGGPAAAAGLRAGDIITAVNGAALDSPQVLQDALDARKPGDTLTLTVTGKDAAGAREIAVTLGADPAEPGKAYLGINIIAFFSHKEDIVPGAEFPGTLHLPHFEEIPVPAAPNCCGQEV